MRMEELAKWLEERDYQVTLCLCKDDQGLYVRMIDTKTGMVRTTILNNHNLSFFEDIITVMYQDIMDALGRVEVSK